MNMTEYISYTIDRISVENMGYDYSIFRNYVNKYAIKWNNAFNDIVYFYFQPSTANINISFGTIDRSNLNKDTIAVNIDLPGKKWRIVLGNDVKWNIGKNGTETFIRKIFGIGEDVEKTLMHEFGHILDIPHSAYPYDVMHIQHPSKNFTKKEIETYREFFNKNIK